MHTHDKTHSEWEGGGGGGNTLQYNKFDIVTMVQNINLDSY